MPRTQIYFVQDGKTHRRENGIIYSMNGIATATQKNSLSNWLKYSPNDVIPHPWEIINEAQEEIEVPEIEIVPTPVPAPAPPATPAPGGFTPDRPQIAPVKKVPIYNIRAVYDDRGRRQGYATHPRF